jgi:2-phosphosulfolactate phosphatase
MGAQALVRTDEDEQCALYLRNLLQGRTSDQQSVRNLVLAGHEAQKYGDPSQSHFLVQDRKMALDIDSIDFAIRVQRVGDLLVARPLSD